MNTLFRLMPVLHAFWKIWLSNYEIFKSSMFGAPVMDKVLPCIESPRPLQVTVLQELTTQLRSEKTVQFNKYFIDCL